MKLFWIDDSLHIFGFNANRRMAGHMTVCALIFVAMSSGYQGFNKVFYEGIFR